MILTGPFRLAMRCDSNQTMALFAARNNPAAGPGAARELGLASAGGDPPDGAPQ